MKMKNVLDQLKAIAETNDSEDVARAIQTADKYSFKDRLAEMEGASVYETEEDDNDISQGDVDDFFGGKDETNVSETPGDDDQYCAVCGNTGTRLDQKDVPCPNCSDEDEGDDGELDQMSKNAGIGECGDDSTADEAFDRIADRVDARKGDGEIAPDNTEQNQDPWGIGDGDDAEVEEDTSQDGGGALDRVQQRAHRSGEGGPLDRLRARKEDKYAALEEEMGRVFQTPMERHSWIMNQLSQIASQMDPEDAALVKRLMKTAGEADVKGGNC